MSREEEMLDLIKRYEQALSEDKAIYFDADEFSDLATYYDAQGDLDAAKDVIRLALKIHPENDVLMIKKAKILAYEERYEDALHLLEGVSSGYDFDMFMVKMECLLELGQLDEAEKVAQVIEENEKGEEFYLVLSEIGFLYAEVDQFEVAITFFERSLAMNPENIDALSDLGYSYEMIGDFENAIRTCNKILDIDAYNYETWVNLGKLYSLSEGYEKAIDAFDFALTINDEDISILKLKAHCLSLSGRALEAILVFKELLEKEPDDSALYLLLCECYTSLELFSEALEMLDKYKENEGETKDFFIKKAIVFYQMGKYQQALLLVDIALKEFGNQVDLLLLSGDIKFNANNKEAAERDYRAAYLLEKDNTEVLDKLAVTAISLEDYGQAIEYTLEQLEADSSPVEVRQRLALLYFEVDDEKNFNEVLSDFRDDDLLELFRLFYEPEHPEYFDREKLLSALNDARECRTLFKNLRH